MTTATAFDNAAKLAEQHTCAEMDKLIMEMLKLAVEQAKFNAEAPKIKPEPAWYPFVAMPAAAAVGAALSILLMKFTG